MDTDGRSEVTPITVDDLPKHSDWPGRILGEVDWTVPDRDLGKIREEYEKDKYQKLLKFQEEEEITDPETIKEKQILGRTWHFSEQEQKENAVCISEKCSLYLAPVLAAQRYNNEKVIETFEGILSGGETVIELGCGYGYNLHLLEREYPDCEFLGGEFSENAVEVAGGLYPDRNITVEQFNYYDEEWPLFNREVDNDLIVFTRLSIEQLPQCASVINTLIESTGDELRNVVHLEPIYKMHDSDSLLQLLRKKYAEINDYNRDLLSVLEKHPEISIQCTEYDVFGFNGLNPMSLARWQPT